MGLINGRKTERIKKEFKRALQTCTPRVLMDHAFTLRYDVTRNHKAINCEVDYNQQTQFPGHFLPACRESVAGTNDTVGTGDTTNCFCYDYRQMEGLKFRPKTYWTDYCKTWRQTVRIQSLALHLSILIVYINTYVLCLHIYLRQPLNNYEKLKKHHITKIFT